MHIYAVQTGERRVSQNHIDLGAEVECICSCVQGDRTRSECPAGIYLSWNRITRSKTKCTQRRVYDSNSMRNPSGLTLN